MFLRPPTPSRWLTIFFKVDNCRMAKLAKSSSYYIATKIIKSIFNKNETCRDVKTLKACEQGSM